MTAPLFKWLIYSTDVTQGIIKDTEGLKFMQCTSDKIRKATCVPKT